VAPGVATPLNVGLAILVMLSPTTPLSLLAGSRSVSAEDVDTVLSQTTPCLAEDDRTRGHTARVPDGFDSAPPFWLLVGLKCWAYCPEQFGRPGTFTLGYYDRCRNPNYDQNGFRHVTVRVPIGADRETSDC
jgi:hypothetical protein